MANYKIEEKKIIADIGKLTSDELKAVQNYVALGYTLVEKPKAKAKTKAEILKDLENFAEYKQDFETAYSLKAKEEEKNIDIIKSLKTKYGIKTKSNTGFHIACQIYAKWKKDNKENEK